MHKLTLTFSCILLTTQITAMEVSQEPANIAITEFPLLNCKEESAAIMTTIIAYCEAKDALRKTCTRVRNIMQNREAILKHPLLRINQNALSKFFPYYGALGNADIVRNLATKEINNETCLDTHICFELVKCAATYEYNEMLAILLAQPHIIEKLITSHRTIQPLLHIAVQYNQITIADQILLALEKKNKESLNFAQKTLTAIQKKHQERFPAIPNIALKPESSPKESVFYYCAMGNCAMISDLLAKGVSPNILDSNGKSLMHYAVECGNLDIVNVLLEHPEFIKTYVVRNLGSPLFTAMIYKRHAIIKLIIEKCIVNIKETISGARLYNYRPEIRILLECNNNTNALNNEERSTLLGDFISCLGSSAHLDSLPIMQALITHGASANKPIENNSTASPSILEGFFEHCSPLHFTAWSRIFITQLLIDSGANADVRTNNNFTPLHIASGLRENITIVEMLIGKGADVNAKNDFGKTPLHYAAEEGSASIIKILLKNGGEINEGDNGSNTPLHTAIANLPDHSDIRDFFENIHQERHHAIEALLADKKLNINAKNNDDKTPLDLVTNRNLRALLISRGAKTSSDLEKEAKNDDCIIQ